MNLNPTTRLALEALYRTLLSGVVLLASILDKPCPVVTRSERRQQARDMLQAIDQR